MIRNIFFVLLAISSSIVEAATWRPAYPAESCHDTCEYFNLEAVSSGVMDYNGVAGQMFVCRLSIVHKAGFQAESHYYHRRGCTIAHGGDEYHRTGHDCLCE